MLLLLLLVVWLQESECQPFTRWLYNLSFGSQGAYVAVPIPPSKQQERRGEKRDSWGGRKGKGGRQQDEDEEAVEE